jgi:hypothetical protein
MIEVRYWKLKHQLFVSDFVTPPVGSAWSLAKHSPLKKHFDETSYRNYEMGLADKFLNDYQVEFANLQRAHAQASNETEDIFKVNENFKNDDDTGPKPLEMANLYGGFFILALGAIISSGLLFLELGKRNKILEKQKRNWEIIRVALKVKNDFKSPHHVNFFKGLFRFPRLVELLFPSTNSSVHLRTRIRNRVNRASRSPKIQIRVQQLV